MRITGVSAPTGLHYSWTWRASPACAVHFVHMNLFGGRAGCGSAGTPGKEGTFPCTDSWIWPEDSLGFLESDLAAHAGPGVLVVTLQHYGVRLTRKTLRPPVAPATATLTTLTPNPTRAQRP